MCSALWSDSKGNHCHTHPPPSLPRWKRVNGGERERRKPFWLLMPGRPFFQFVSFHRKTETDIETAGWFEEVKHSETSLRKFYLAREGVLKAGVRHAYANAGQGRRTPSDRTCLELSCLLRGNVWALPVREGWALSGCRPGLRSWGGAHISCQSTWGGWDLHISIDSTINTIFYAVWTDTKLCKFF